jgi:hypothetical protein
MLCDYPGGPTVVLISSMANQTAIDHVIRGHYATLTFTREGFEIRPEAKIAQQEKAPKADEIKPISYKKKGAEDVTLHHRNLQQAIRKGDALRCDHMLGYYGVVVTMMGVESYRTEAYLKWNAAQEKVERT